MTPPARKTRGRDNSTHKTGCHVVRNVYKEAAKLVIIVGVQPLRRRTVSSKFTWRYLIKKSDRMPKENTPLGVHFDNGFKQVRLQALRAKRRDFRADGRKWRLKAPPYHNPIQMCDATSASWRQPPTSAAKRKPDRSGIFSLFSLCFTLSLVFLLSTQL